MSDYHLHLHPHSPLPGAPPMGEYPAGHIERYVEAAAERGVTELGFTEHLYRCVESEPVFGRWWKSDANPTHVAQMEHMLSAERNLSLPRYVDAVLGAKARGLPVKLGLEVDFEPGTEAAVAELLAPYPWDFLIGSVHWLGAWDFMHAEGDSALPADAAGDAWRRYFALSAQLAASGLVDVVAHPDVLKKVVAPPPDELDTLYATLVDAAAAGGIALEVSSGGLRTAAAEICPAPPLLRLAFEAGIPITLASDGHVPELAGFGRADVVGAARAAGYTTHLRFERRRRLITPLPAVAVA